jgi:hypothetical protein
VSTETEVAIENNDTLDTRREDVLDVVAIFEGAEAWFVDVLDPAEDVACDDILELVEEVLVSDWGARVEVDNVDGEDEVDEGSDDAPEVYTSK